MRPNFKIFISLIFLTFNLFFMVPLPSHAGVRFFDTVTTVGVPVRLKVLTQRAFFSQPGARVDIFIDGTPKAKILTGGDGYGFFKYTPQHMGLKQVDLIAGNSQNSGSLLVMDRADKAVFVEIEGSFRPPFLLDQFTSEGKKVLEILSERYRIIYYFRFLGTFISKKFLEKFGFPKSVVLDWDGANSLEKIKARGVRLYAIIGSLKTLSAASEYFEKKITLEASQDDLSVKDWAEVLKKLE